MRQFRSGNARTAFTGSRVLDPANAGFSATPRALAVASAGLLLGLATYWLQGAPSREPLVIGNAFAQALVVSAAEVVVCWSVFGATLRSVLAPRLGKWSVTVASIAASVLFGIYHYAHSPPFNTFAMVALLSAVGIATSVFFFASRDAAGTILFHNGLALFGIVSALVQAQGVGAFRLARPDLLGVAALCVGLVVCGYVLLRRVKAVGTGERAPGSAAAG